MVYKNMDNSVVFFKKVISLISKCIKSLLKTINFSSIINFVVILYRQRVPFFCLFKYDAFRFIFLESK